uniref:Ion transport domain-containing protein n=1 Tax=Spongospora subterranea TaxID=70186 RepID=A0A0H5RCG7_9EUKA|eukprot:CRZ11446.1 hypothetical protein [Spongospora subterranea]
MLSSLTGKSPNHGDSTSTSLTDQQTTIAGLYLRDAISWRSPSLLIARCPRLGLSRFLSYHVVHSRIYRFLLFSIIALHFSLPWGFGVLPSQTLSRLWLGIGIDTIIVLFYLTDEFLHLYVRPDALYKDFLSLGNFRRIAMVISMIDLIVSISLATLQISSFRIFRLMAPIFLLHTSDYVRLLFAFTIEASVMILSLPLALTMATLIMGSLIGHILFSSQSIISVRNSLQFTTLAESFNSVAVLISTFDFKSNLPQSSFVSTIFFMMIVGIILTITAIIMSKMIVIFDYRKSIYLKASFVAQSESIAAAFDIASRGNEFVSSSDWVAVMGIARPDLTRAEAMAIFHCIAVPSTESIDRQRWPDISTFIGVHIERTTIHNSSHPTLSMMFMGGLDDRRPAEVRRKKLKHFLCEPLVVNAINTLIVVNLFACLNWVSSNGANTDSAIVFIMICCQIIFIIDIFLRLFAFGLELSTDFVNVVDTIFVIITPFGYLPVSSLQYVRVVSGLRCFLWYRSMGSITTSNGIVTRLAPFVLAFTGLIVVVAFVFVLVGQAMFGLINDDITRRFAMLTQRDPSLAQSWLSADFYSFTFAGFSSTCSTLIAIATSTQWLKIAQGYSILYDGSRISALVYFSVYRFVANIVLASALMVVIIEGFQLTIPPIGETSWQKQLQIALTLSHSNTSGLCWKIWRRRVLAQLVLDRMELIKIKLDTVSKDLGLHRQRDEEGDDNGKHLVEVQISPSSENGDQRSFPFRESDGKILEFEVIST